MTDHDRRLRSIRLAMRKMSAYRAIDYAQAPATWDTPDAEGMTPRQRWAAAHERDEESRADQDRLDREERGHAD